MKNPLLLASTALFLGLGLQGCIFNESGDKYNEPNANTEPSINLNYDSQSAVNTYLTFDTDSADITVTFGSQEFTLPDRSEMYLKGFGGFETDRVWKTSIVEDTRGIKTLRMGYFVSTPNTTNISAPVFHNFAKDTRGNIYLTETAEQLKSDLGVAPFRQASPALLFPAKVAVGESWVAGPSLVPLFYDFRSGTGWTATLVDDNATAPISGTSNCILIKYYGESFSYYLYLKSDVGVVEWVNSWEEATDGTVAPINGWALSDAGTGSTNVPYTGFGWSDDSSNPVGGLFLSLGLKVVPGEEANANTGQSSPVNTSEFGFTRIIETTPPASNSYPALQELLVPDERGVEEINFTDAKWDALAGQFYHPSIKVLFNGKTYIADETTGSFKLSKLYNQPFGPAKLAFLGQGTLINEADANDSFEFVGLMEGNYFNAGPDGLTSDFAIAGLDPERRLPAAKPGSTYRIYASYAFLGEPLKPVIEFDQATIDEFQLTDEQLQYTSTCFGNLDGDGLCASINVSFEFTVPDSEGELMLRMGGLDASNTAKSASRVFYLPISANAGTKGPLTARLYDQFDDVIRGSRDGNGEFNTGILNALSSVAPESNIVKYSFDLGDGTVVDESTPFGSYTYTQDGEYQIKLTVTDDQGNTASTFRKVVVSDNGKITIRNIANEFGSGFFYVGIDNIDNGSDGYYDFYKFVTLKKGEEEVFDVPGGFRYEIDIIDDGELQFTTDEFVGAADNIVVEVDLDPK